MMMLPVLCTRSRNVRQGLYRSNLAATSMCHLACTTHAWPGLLQRDTTLSPALANKISCESCSNTCSPLSKSRPRPCHYPRDICHLRSAAARTMSSVVAPSRHRTAFHRSFQHGHLPGFCRNVVVRAKMRQFKASSIPKSMLHTYIMLFFYLDSAGTCYAPAPCIVL